MSPRKSISFSRFFTYLTLAVLGGGLLAPVVSYATLTLDSTSLTSDGALNLKSASSSAINFGHPDQSGTITIASSTQTLTLNLGVGSGATTVNIATGTSTAKTINIGTGVNTANTITIGSASSNVSIGGSITVSSSTINSLLYINNSNNLSSLASSTAGRVLTATSTAPYFVWDNKGVPSGAIMFFNLSTCPTGWTEATEARGRYVVSLPSGGTLASTTGTALTNLENRAAGQHYHGFRDAQSIQGGYSANARHLITTDAGRTSSDVSPISSATAWVGAEETGTVYVPSGPSLVAGTNAPYIQYLTCSKD